MRMGLVGKKLLGGAATAAGAVVSIARHVAWYVNHHSGRDRR
jgi:hypothetical protein